MGGIFGRATRPRDGACRVTKNIQSQMFYSNFKNQVNEQNNEGPGLRRPWENRTKGNTPPKN